MRRYWLMVSILAAPALAVAQTTQNTTPQVVTLSLAEATQQARNSSPEYRQQLNNANTSRAQVRAAYGNLLPDASVSGGMDYSGAGRVNYGQGLTRQTSALVGSSYNLGLGWVIDGTRILAPSEQKAYQQAVDHDIANEEARLRYSIAEQYLTAAASAAEVIVARQQVERNQTFLDLANAKYRVGQGTLIEVRQAEVQKSQADVDLLRQVYFEQDAKLELFRRIGVSPPVPVDQIALTDTFPVLAPAFTLEEVLREAKDYNPNLKSLQSRQQAADVSIKSAKSDYLPSLSLRAGWSGFTQQQTDESLLLQQSTSLAQGGAANCADNEVIRASAGLPSSLPPGGTCNSAFGLNPAGSQLTSQAQNTIVNANSKFPFEFDKQPFGASLTISLPIFSGFSRQLRVQQARELQQDAAESVRAQQLQVESAVTSRFLAFQTTYSAIAAQAAARDAARDQLRLAQDRYRLGSGTALEVTDAQSTVRRAEGDYIAAIYEYHKALAALEAAVGRPLRRQ